MQHNVGIAHLSQVLEASGKRIERLSQLQMGLALHEPLANHLAGLVHDGVHCHERVRPVGQIDVIGTLEGVVAAKEPEHTQIEVVSIRF